LNEGYIKYIPLLEKVSFKNLPFSFGYKFLIILNII